MVSLSWGESSRSPGKPDVSRISKRHLQEALDGLRRGLDRFTDDENDRKIRERYKDIMARVEMALRDMEL